MAELSWKGKKRIDVQSFLSSLGHFHTIETYSTLPSNQISQSLFSTNNTWHNRLIYGNNIETLPALLKEFAHSINLIYIDPPFMTGRNFMSRAQVAYSDRWNNNLDEYLQWLYEVLFFLHLLLIENGSLYVHLDWHAVHYAKVMLDEIFGYSANAKGAGFKSEIIWHYQSGGRAQQWYARKHDTILLYTKSAEYCFHAERIGDRRGQQKRNHMRKETAADGRITWTIRSSGRTYSYDEDTLMTPSDVWNDISHLHQKDPERNGYATQKPAALLERIILASSEENDLVLDCFCGSGVTPVVAEQLSRRWIACDQSKLAIASTKQRLLKQEHLQPMIIQNVVLTEQDDHPSV